MADRITFRGRGRGCAVSAPLIVGDAYPPAHVTDNAVSITEPRVKFVKGWLTDPSDTTSVAPKPQDPMDGSVECGEGTEYQIKVTPGQLFEIMYRVRRAKMVSGGYSASASSLRTRYQSDGDIDRVTQKTASATVSLGSGELPVNTVHAYYPDPVLTTYPYVLFTGGGTATDLHETYTDTYDAELDEYTTVYTGEFEEGSDTGSGRKSMIGSQSINFFGDAYELPYPHDPVHGKLKARNPVSELAYWSRLTDLDNAFNMGVWYESFTDPTSSILYEYGLFSFSSYEQELTWYASNGTPHPTQYTEGEGYDAAGPSLVIHPEVAFTGASPFSSDSELYLKVYLRSSVYMNAGLSGTTCIINAVRPTPSPYNEVLNSDHFLKLKLSGGQVVQCPIYASINGRGSTLDGEFNSYVSYSVDSVSDFVFEAVEWWPYATNAAVPAWDTATGAGANGGPEA